MNKLIALMTIWAGVFSCNISAFTVYNQSALQFDEVYWVSNDRETLIGNLSACYNPMGNKIQVTLTKEQLGMTFGIRLINKDQNKEFYFDSGSLRIVSQARQDSGVMIFPAPRASETQDDGIFVGIVKEQYIPKTLLETLTLEPGK